MKKMLENKAFIDKSKGGTVPTRYKQLLCHIIYDVKHVGRHKARIVFVGHLTDPNTESLYSGEVSLCGLQLIELKELELWGFVVGNVYFEVNTKYFVYIIGGTEFRPFEGPTLVITILYG
jgi:hypothetical protein